MKSRSTLRFALAVSLAAASGFFAARALPAAEQKTHFAADSDEVSLTETAMKSHLSQATGTIKKLADACTVDNIEAGKAEREAALNASLKPLGEDIALLTFQANLLCIDSVADKTGDQAEQFLQQNIYTKLGVDAAEVAKRRQSTGLGHGSLILGYAIAKAGKLSPDEVFKAKQGHAWPEVLREKGVTVDQVGAVLK
jgi:hypothetical protein